MSDALKRALQVSFEQAQLEEQQVTRQELAELMDEAPDGYPSQFAKEVGDGLASALQLDEIATMAEAGIESGSACKASVESLTLALNGIRRQYRLERETLSQEAYSDPTTAQRHLAQQARQLATTLRETIRASHEAFSFKGLFSDAKGLDADAQDLRAAKVELDAVQHVLDQASVLINHFAVFQFLTVDNKPTTDIPGAIQAEAKNLETLYKHAMDVHATAEKSAALLRSLDFDSDEAVRHAAQEIYTLGGELKKLTALQGMKLMGNRSINVYKEHVMGYGDRMTYMYEVLLFEEDAKPSNKAAWWARALGFVAGYSGANNLARLGTGLAFWAFGGLIPTAAAPVVSVAAGVFVIAQSFKGAFKGVDIADKLGGSAKVVTDTPVGDLQHAVIAVERLNAKALEYRQTVIEAYGRLKKLGEENKVKLNEAKASHEAIAELREALWEVDMLHHAESTAFEALIDQVRYVSQCTVKVCEKVIKAAKHARDNLL